MSSKEINIIKPYLLFSRPGSSFVIGEKVMVSVYNPSSLPLNLMVSHIDLAGKRKLIMDKPWVSNPMVLDVTSEGGRIQLFAREQAEDGNKPLQSNAIWGEVLDDSPTAKEIVANERECAHRIDSAIQKSSAGVLTLHNPWVFPGNAMRAQKRQWFPVAVMEGSTPLYNMEVDYYEDPLKYLVRCLQQLLDKGFNFITWHDVIDGSVDTQQKNALLQFDVDAGRNSFLRVSQAMVKLGIRATAMVHCRARHWYHYDLSQTDITAIQKLESAGWAIGYHHNSLTNLVALEPHRASEPGIVLQAQKGMHDDVVELRKNFNIRTLTHHGGNLYNNRVEIPEDLDIVCVDKSFSPELWRDLKSSFSDGGFLARPMPLSDFTSLANKDSIFLRCHPLKYGNFPDGLDVKPLVSMEQAHHTVSTSESGLSVLSDLEKQKFWIDSRSMSRSGASLGYASTNKPLSSKFISSDSIEKSIEMLRARRRPDFIRQYPWVDGDPRVMWWRLLSSHTRKGRFLNVGAMPPDQRDETWAFIEEGSEIIELDIEPKREPDILADFCADDIPLDNKVDLNGLPYFSDPEKAVRNAYRILNASGTLLIGAAADSHPERGGMFRPHDRPTWRMEDKSKQGESLSLITKLWSFSDRSIADLESVWGGDWSAEFINNYWFVVARKDSDA